MYKDMIYQCKFILGQVRTLRRYWWSVWCVDTY